MTSSFIERLSQTIAAECKQPENVLIILPSRRAGTFLKRALAKAYQKNILSPSFYTFDDLVEELTSFQSIDNFNLFLRLHSCYEQLLSEEGLPAENLEAFLNWAPTLLSDFNDIDRYLVNSLDLFASIDEVRAIETWNIKGEPLTPTQEEYIALWKRIGKLYQRFTRDLVSQRISYPGLAFRVAAETLEEVHPQLKYEHIYFAGFNALSASEEAIIKYLVRIKKASIFFDADQFYLNNEMHEAGTFIRSFQQNWNFTKINWVSDSLSQPKTINIRSCSSSYAQAVVCADILAEVNLQEELNTAIILNKEELLVPVLYNLPDNISALNITMGYPVGNSPLSSFVNALIALWQSPQQRAKSAFYHKTLVDVLNHSFFVHLYPEPASIDVLKEQIIERNYVYVSTKRILSTLKESESIAFLFEVENQSLAYCNDKMLSVLELLKSNLIAAAQSADQKKQVEYSLLLEQVHHFTVVFRKISTLTQEFESLRNCSLRLFRKLIQQLINREKIAFVGEPLKGIQLMGLLETRALDFDHVILLNVNEGVLPAGKKNNSLLPLDIKKKFGLPSYQEQDAVFAHHFYRLLQRAQKVDLIYQSSSDDFGSGAEPSRFIEQIKHEFPPLGITVNEIPYEPETEISAKEKVIKKDQNTLKKIKAHLAHGLSPSAINKYLTCPLDYYYRYVLDLGEQEELEEDIQSSTFGTCIHNTIEKLHENHLGKALDSIILKEFETKCDQILTDEFLSFFAKEDLERGKNLLTFEAAKKYVREFLRFQKSLNEKNQIVHLATEQKIKATAEVHLAGREQIVHLKGTIDSILTVGGLPHLLDYKSGRVEINDLKLYSNKLELKSLKKKQKALQLLSYAYQYYQENPEAPELIPCIYSFRNKQAGLIPLKLDNQNITKSEVLDLYPQLLESILTPLLSLEEDFQHDVDSSYCQYCQ